MELLNEIYKKDELFYWCNCLGEINMPGDGHFIVHKAEELPPRYFELYEKYQMETDECHRYVVSFRGRPGMLLTALHVEEYYFDVLNMESRPATLDGIMARECIRKIAALLVMRQCEKMSHDKRLDGCIPIFGEDTDPDGHELALFIPEDRASDIDSLQKIFLEYCWTRADERTLIRSSSCFYFIE